MTRPVTGGLFWRCGVWRKCSEKPRLVSGKGKAAPTFPAQKRERRNSRSLRDTEPGQAFGRATSHPHFCTRHDPGACHPVCLKRVIKDRNAGGEPRGAVGADRAPSPHPSPQSMHSGGEGAQTASIVSHACEAGNSRCIRGHTTHTLGVQCDGEARGSLPLPAGERSGQRPG